MHLVILLAALLSGGGRTADATSRVIHARASAVPAWVPLSESVDREGHLRWDVIGQDAKENFEQVAANTPLEVTSPSELPRGKERYDLRLSGQLPDCVYYGPSYNHFSSRPRETLDDLAASADWSVRGHVIRITPGFFNGEPFSLLTVEVDRSVRGTSPDRILYLLYPYAQFRAGDVRFCKDDYRFPHIPAVSDELLLFAPRGRVGVEVPLLMPDRNYVIFESHEHRLVLPRELKLGDNDPTSLDAVEAHVRAARPEAR